MQILFFELFDRRSSAQYSRIYVRLIMEEGSKFATSGLINLISPLFSQSLLRVSFRFEALLHKSPFEETFGIGYYGNGFFVQNTLKHCKTLLSENI
jgi:hypothetical protein